MSACYEDALELYSAAECVIPETDAVQARLAVCSSAAGVDDARDLLLMLGLLSEETAARGVEAARVEDQLLSEASEWVSMHDWMKDNKYMQESGTCWFCDRELPEADAPKLLVAHQGDTVLACSNCGGEPG